MITRPLATALILLAVAPPQDPPSKVDPIKVGQAVDRGCRFLAPYLKKPSSAGDADMLVLLTLIHGGATSGQLQPLIERALERELKRTYNVSLMAMSLYELWKQTASDEAKARYGRRLRQCAQWLVDNQTAHGQWRYGHCVPLDAEPPAPEINGVETPSSASSSRKAGSGATQSGAPIRRRAYGTDGDNSNAQYAALGLRACMDAGIEIPREALELALRWWEGSQARDGGWCYMDGAETKEDSFGSMTAGAAGAIAIYKYYLHRNSKAVRNDPSIQRGLKWLEENFAVDQNPKLKTHWHFYYLYALERAGMLAGTEFLGRHEWYPVGVTWLLRHQRDDGSWKAVGGKGADELFDTCFAILFLRRVTRPLTETKAAK